MSTFSYPFTPAELTRLAHYRAAVGVGFYHDGWGTAEPELPVHEGARFARPLTASAVERWRERVGELAAACPDGLAASLTRLGVVRGRVYLQETGDGAVVLVTYHCRSDTDLDERALGEQFLQLLGLEPGQPGPAGTARLVLDLEVSGADARSAAV
ncbi:MAG: hypothetical protein JO023_23345 [Chloroflexi bacterium]|nr:hypothetical protein [Chloroflexota bacterium]